MDLAGEPYGLGISISSEKPINIPSVSNAIATTELKMIALIFFAFY